MLLPWLVMKLIVASGFIAALGMMPVYAYTQLVQPQLDSLKTIYGSMDQTAQDIVSGKDYKTTNTYQQSKVLSDSWQLQR